MIIINRESRFYESVVGLNPLSRMCFITSLLCFHTDWYYCGVSMV